LIIYDFPVESKEANNNLRNQSVAVLIVHTNNCSGNKCLAPKIEVNVPTNCKYTTSQEEVNGTLVIKVNMTCDTTVTQSIIPPKDKEEEQTCPWYNQYPCWTKAQKGLFWGAVGTGAVAAILSTTCIDIGGGGGGNPGGGNGGGIRIGNCH
jgi:hypothetical protein